MKTVKHRINSEDSPGYAICCFQRNDYWYFVEYDDDTNKAVWSANLNCAQIFYTSSGAEEFKEIYLDDRQCDIVRIE